MDPSRLNFDQKSLLAAIGAVELVDALQPTCEYYSLLFGRRADEDRSLSAPLNFLSLICSLRFNTDDPRNPFRVSSEPSRAVSDLVTVEQGAMIASSVAAIDDVELRSRLSDVAWVVTGDHTLARGACTDYLDSANRLIASESVRGIEDRLMRAAQLAMMLGDSNGLITDVTNRIYEIAATEGVHDPSLYSSLLVLLTIKSADSALLYRISAGRAREIADSGTRYQWQRNFWELAVNFATKGRDEEAKQAALLSFAKSYEREADVVAHSYQKAHFYECSVQAYRRCSGAAAHVDRVHAKMLEAQEVMQQEMVAICDVSFDNSKLANLARQRISSDSRKSFAELIVCWGLPHRDELKEQAAGYVEEFPLQHMFQQVQLTGTGKVAAKAPPALPSSHGCDEEGLWVEECRQFKFWVAVVTNGAIEVMRREFLDRHSIQSEVIAEAVQSSGIVPPGRVEFFSNGIRAGLEGDLLSALHILVPQLEGLFRYWLSRHGLVTSTIDRRGIQREKYLNELLVMQQSVELFGEDLVLAMRVVFVERFGFNLRNELSHAMLEPEYFRTDKALFSWWLILHLACGHWADKVIGENS